jgi:hypothetical protein
LILTAGYFLQSVFMEDCLVNPWLLELWGQGASTNTVYCDCPTGKKTGIRIGGAV